MPPLKAQFLDTCPVLGFLGLGCVCGGYVGDNQQSGGSMFIVTLRHYSFEYHFSVYEDLGLGSMLTDLM